MLVPKLTSVIAAIAAAALIAVTAVPAYATDTADAEKTTNLSACVGDATDTAGFEDVYDLTVGRQDAINCLAYYSITHGRTAKEFDPHANVTRSQMALFLHRLAVVAGVDFEPDADDPAAMFGDISHLGDDRQTAIKALYSKGVMTGRAISVMALGAPGDDLFYPGELINRAEMAVYLRNLMQAASPDLFNDDNELIGVESLDEFPDARLSVPTAASEAIATIYELGITTGQTPTTYNADGFVARSNMALFLTRTLAHTAVRPAGLTAQNDGATVVVSQRDRDFQPVDDVRVDVFTTDTDTAGDAFDRDGSCDRSAVRAAPRFFHDACVIDLGDATTDNGDVLVDLADDMTSDGLVVWAWTGRLGDEIGEEFDADDALELRFSGDNLPAPDASKLTVTYSGLSSNPADGTPVLTARKGAPVTVHLQLQGAYPDETDYVDVGSPDGGAEYDVTITATIPDDDDQTDDEVEYLRSTSVVLAADGSGSFDLPALNSDAYDVTYELSEVEGAVTPPAEHRGDGAGVTVKFRSGDAEPTTVLAVAYRDTIDVPATGTARNSVRITVLDQYGRPLRGVAVLLESSADGADPDIWRLSQENRTFTTGRSGVSVGYVYSGDAAAVETVTTGVDNDAEGETGNGELNCGTANSDDVCGMATVYWTTGDVAADQVPVLNVLAADADANTVMVDTDTDAAVAPARVVYDTGDYFHIGGRPVSEADFEEALTDRLDDIDTAATGVVIPQPTLAWDNYDPADADPITRWFLIVPAA